MKTWLRYWWLQQPQTFVFALLVVPAIIAMMFTNDVQGAGYAGTQLHTSFTLMMYMSFMAAIAGLYISSDNLLLTPKLEKKLKNLIIAVSITCLLLMTFPALKFSPNTLATSALLWGGCIWLMTWHFLRPNKFSSHMMLFPTIMFLGLQQFMTLPLLHTGWAYLGYLIGAAGLISLWRGKTNIQNRPLPIQQKPDLNLNRFGGWLQGVGTQNHKIINFLGSYTRAYQGALGMGLLIWTLSLPLAYALSTQVDNIVHIMTATLIIMATLSAAFPLMRPTRGRALPDLSNIAITPTPAKANTAESSTSSREQVTKRLLNSSLYTYSLSILPLVFLMLASQMKMNNSGLDIVIHSAYVLTVVFFMWSLAWLMVSHDINEWISILLLLGMPFLGIMLFPESGEAGIKMQPIIIMLTALISVVFYKKSINGISKMDWA